MNEYQLIRGTSPKLTFTLPFPAADLTEFNLIIADAFSVRHLVEKNLSDCSAEESAITLTLSQADTLALPCGIVLAQVRLLLSNRAMSTRVFRFRVADTLNEEVLA